MQCCFFFVKWSLFCVCACVYELMLCVSYFFVSAKIVYTEMPTIYLIADVTELNQRQ